MTMRQIVSLAIFLCVGLSTSKNSTHSDEYVTSAVEAVNSTTPLATSTDKLASSKKEQAGSTIKQASTTLSVRTTTKRATPNDTSTSTEPSTANSISSVTSTTYRPHKGNNSIEASVSTRCYQALNRHTSELDTCETSVVDNTIDQVDHGDGNYYHVKRDVCCMLKYVDNCVADILTPWCSSDDLDALSVQYSETAKSTFDNRETGWSYITCGDFNTGICGNGAAHIYPAITIIVLAIVSFI